MLSLGIYAFINAFHIAIDELIKKGVNRILYYIVILPISKTPFWLLNALGVVVFFVLFRIIRYRKTVVMDNLTLAFPKMDDSERKSIAKSSYKNLALRLVEGIKNISIPKETLLERIKVENPQLMEDLFEQNKSVVLVGAHYHNWEYMITAQNLLFKHQAVGIGRTISNSYLNRKINEKRSRFGMRIVSSANIRECLEEWSEERLAILTLFDQSPPNARKAYWKDFLGVSTGFFFGPEKLAVTHDMAVVQFEIHSAKKGYYSIHLKLITDQPRALEYGEITEALIRNLESQIVREPAPWLWSHKRWKKEVPENVDELRADFRAKHEKWLRTLDP